MNKLKAGDRVRGIHAKHLTGTVKASFGDGNVLLKLDEGQTCTATFKDGRETIADEGWVPEEYLELISSSDWKDIWDDHSK